jgi:hypothetical protein
MSYTKIPATVIEATQSQCNSTRKHREAALVEVLDANNKCDLAADVIRRLVQPAPAVRLPGLARQGKGLTAGSFADRAHFRVFSLTSVELSVLDGYAHPNENSVLVVRNRAGYQGRESSSS